MPSYVPRARSCVTHDGLFGCYIQILVSDGSGMSVTHFTTVGHIAALTWICAELIKFPTLMHPNTCPMGFSAGCY